MSENLIQKECLVMSSNKLGRAFACLLDSYASAKVWLVESGAASWAREASFVLSVDERGFISKPSVIPLAALRFEDAIHVQFGFLFGEIPDTKLKALLMKTPTDTVWFSDRPRELLKKSVVVDFSQWKAKEIRPKHFTLETKNGLQIRSTAEKNAARQWKRTFQQMGLEVKSPAGRAHESWKSWAQSLESA